MDQQLEFYDLQRQAIWIQFKELVQTCSLDVENYYRLSGVARELIRLDFEISGQVMSQLMDKSRFNVPLKKRKRSRSTKVHTAIQVEPLPTVIELEPMLPLEQSSVQITNPNV